MQNSFKAIAAVVLGLSLLLGGCKPQPKSGSGEQGGQTADFSINKVEFKDDVVGAIEKARLTKDEKRIANVLAGTANPGIFYLRQSRMVKSYKLSIHYFTEQSWRSEPIGLYNAEGDSGTIYIAEPNTENNELRISVQSGNTTSALSVPISFAINPDYISNKQYNEGGFPLSLGQVFPLYCYIQSSGDDIKFSGLEKDFKEPGAVISGTGVEAFVITLELDDEV